MSSTPPRNSSSISPRTLDEFLFCSICAREQPIELKCGLCARNITYSCQPPQKCWGIPLNRRGIPPKNDYCRYCRALYSLDRKDGKEVPEDVDELVKVYELTPEEYMCPMPIPEEEKEPFTIITISQEPSIVLIAGVKPTKNINELNGPPPSPSASIGALSEESFDPERPPSAFSGASSGVYSGVLRARPPPLTEYDRLRTKLHEKLEEEETQKMRTARSPVPEFDQEKMARVVDQAVIEFKRIREARRYE